MRTRFILLVLIILPFFVSAQSNNQQMHQQINAQRQRWTNDWQMGVMTSHSSNKIQSAEKKVAKEEENKKNLEEKSEKLNADLKTKQEELTNLKNNSADSNNIDLQKDIEKTQEKLNQNKKELESSSKKIEDLKTQLETSKSQEEEKRKKEGKTIYTLTK
ncbi:hypothetical protein ACHRVZ_10865 [Flavobacterium sp. FlaQc-57]|uniref:hypothetical protein n=1 Tax=Flavobacterium sp. FlaQc-57 TaxID=3374186 RepID=UPI003756FCA4